MLHQEIILSEGKNFLKHGCHDFQSVYLVSKYLLKQMTIFNKYRSRSNQILCSYLVGCCLMSDLFRKGEPILGKV